LEAGMTIGNDEELERLKHVGRVVAATLKTMAAAIEPGMTTQQLARRHDLIGGNAPV
jgi:methionine aminopeptidase